MHSNGMCLNGPVKPGNLCQVCNAASKLSGNSLKDKLLTGSNQLQNLIGKLVRLEERFAIDAMLKTWKEQLKTVKIQ